MRSLARLIALTSLVLWGAPLFAASVTPTQSVRISIALPVAQFDFSDMDLRDEFNRPISAPAVRVRFEEQVARELNRLLVQNLTPSRRAFYELLNRDRHAFARWFTKAVEKAAERILASIPHSPRLERLWRAWPSPIAAASQSIHRSDGDASGLFISCVIASTRLLR